MTKHKPATPLPWESGMVDTESRVVVYYSIGQAMNLSGKEVAMTVTGTPSSGENAAYIAHAANAYPRLVEALRKVAGVYSGADDAPMYAHRAITLLRELGEE